MTAVVVGASAGLGRALASELAARRRSILLAASDRRDLEATASDLRLRFGVDAGVLACDAADPEAMGASLRDACAALPAVETLLLPLGAVDEADEPLLEGPSAARLVDVNLLSVCAAVRAVAPRLIEQRRGDVVGFGSIAAIRGRTRNAVYAAAKRALASYFESLQHALRPHGVNVCFYVLGYMDTGLAYGRPLLLPKAAPAAVARHVCRGLGRRSGVHYLPRFWYPVAVALRSLPGPIYRRLDF
ncbi:MAG TPA: SDR family NAD(P)-dependent oxidoreductase [Thermoanaerobaculia bacterium]|nr:SDR family NAD(P)-dependent oxidoreductase [Thermoanaerobaculia bacterium]